eukprot:1243144-Prymnesium_polylepis.1
MVSARAAHTRLPRPPEIRSATPCSCARLQWARARAAGMLLLLAAAGAGVVGGVLHLEDGDEGHVLRRTHCPIGLGFLRRHGRFRSPCAAEQEPSAAVRATSPELVLGSGGSTRLNPVALLTVRRKTQYSCGLDH